MNGVLSSLISDTALPGPGSHVTHLMSLDGSISSGDPGTVGGATLPGDDAKGGVGCSPAGSIHANVSSL